jgi:hypothetical protein
VNLQLTARLTVSDSGPWISAHFEFTLHSPHFTQLHLKKLGFPTRRIFQRHPPSSRAWCYYFDFPWPSCHDCGILLCPAIPPTLKALPRFCGIFSTNQPLTCTPDPKFSSHWGRSIVPLFVPALQSQVSRGGEGRRNDGDGECAFLPNTTSHSCLSENIA